MATIKILFALILACSPAFSVPQITVKHLSETPYREDVKAEDQLQQAIDDPTTVCGDIIEIDPGASRHYTYPYILRGPALDPALGGPLVAPSYAKDCASSGKYITIRSSLAYQLTPGKRVGAADAANLAFVGLVPFIDNICAVFTTEMAASFWRLQGLEIASSQVACNQGGNALIMATYTVYAGAYASGRLDQFINHITIDQCWLHGLDGYPLRDGIFLDGNLMTISNSTLENIRTGADNQQESHAILMENGRGPVRIINNKLTSQGINLISGGEITPTLRGVEYMELANNWIYKPFKLLDWSGTTNPTPSSPCPLDSDGHGATYQNTTGSTYWECQGAAPGTWTSISSGTYTALVASRISGGPQKNLIEFKRITNFHMEGNLMDQAPDYSADNQHATCLLFSLLDGPSGKHENALVENNVCRHAAWGFRTTYDLEPKNPNGHTHYWANAGHAQHNIVVRNNLYHHMGENITTAPGFGQVCGESGYFGCSAGMGSYVGNVMDAVAIDHNTFESRLVTAGYDYLNTGFRLDGIFMRDGLTAPNQRVTNNIMTSGRRPISAGAGNNDNNAVAALWGPYAEIAANGFIDNLNLGLGTDGVIYHCTEGTPGCPYTGAYTAYPPNCLGNGGSVSVSLTKGACKYGVSADLGFTDYPDDLTLQSGSPLKAAALDGKDLGADLNTVGWATAGAEAGTMAPYLAMKIRLIRPASTSAFVRFSAIDTSSCTVEARVYGFPLSSPVATATVNTGDLDRTATLTGLTASTKYGLKVTCAGSYYREDDFRTP